VEAVAALEDRCDAENKKLIDEFMKMDEAKLNEKIEEKAAALKKVDDDQEAFLKELQEQYEQSTKEADAKKKAIKEGGLGLMKSVSAHRKTVKSEL